MFFQMTLWSILNLCTSRNKEELGRRRRRKDTKQEQISIAKMSQERQQADGTRQQKLILNYICERL